MGGIAEEVRDYQRKTEEKSVGEMKAWAALQRKSETIREKLKKRASVK